MLGGRAEDSLLRPSELGKTCRKAGEEAEETQRGRGGEGSIPEITGDVWL